MFKEPLFNCFVEDVESSVRFFRDHLGFVETFRVPIEGTPAHVELKLDGVVIAFSSFDAARREHGLDVRPGIPQSEIVLWTEDADVAYHMLVAKGATPVSPPHTFRGRLRTGRVSDPNGILVSITANVEETQAPSSVN